MTFQFLAIQTLSKTKLMTAIEVILVPNRTGGVDDFNSLMKGVWGTYWPIHWGSEIVKRLRIPVFEEHVQICIGNKIKSKNFKKSIKYLLYNSVCQEETLQ